MSLILTHDTISKILGSPAGVFVAATICSDVRRGISYQLIDGTPITSTCPSDLLRVLGSKVEISVEANPVAAFFAPQMAFASDEMKYKLVVQLLDYAQELAHSLN